MIGSRRTRSAVLTTLVIASLGPSDEAASQSRVTLVAPREGVKVRLVPEGNERVGHAEVVFASRARRDQRVRIRYVLDEPGYRVTVTLRARSGKRTVEDPATRLRGVMVPVQARDVISATLDFALPITSAGAATGRLVVVPERRSRPRRVSGPALVIPVAVRRAEDVDVRPDPSRVELGVERTPWLLSPIEGPHTSGDSTAVILRGRGADALADSVEKGAQIDAVLRGNGRQVIAKATLERETHGQVRVDVDVDEADEPGRYEGKLVFGDSPEAVGVSVTAVVRTTIWMAILVIFLGVLAGQLVPRLLERYRLRAQLKRDLKQTVERYADARGISTRTDSSGMDRLIGRWAWDPTNRVDTDDRASRIARTLAVTGSPDELRDLDQDVRSLEEQTRRWLEVEQAASRVREVSALHLPEREGAEQVFSNTPPGLATRAVLTHAYTEVRTDEEVDARVSELDALREVLPDAQAIWRYQYQLDQLNVSRQSRSRWELKSLWPATYPGGDTAFEDLAARLTAARDRLERAVKRAKEQKPDAPGQAVPGDDGEPVDGQMNPPSAPPRGRPSRWARARGFARAPTRWARLWLPELIISLTAMAVASAAYALTLYGETWGSEEDYITAFAAGFFGRVAVDVARLQLFRPARQRRGVPPTTPAGPEPPAPTPAADGGAPETAPRQPANAQ